jgi:hypothetical protein
VTVLRWLGLVAGTGLAVAAASSIVFTLVLPRAHPSRLSDLVLRGTHHAAKALADRIEDYERQDRFMSLGGPLALLLLFAVWVVLFLVAYSLVLWPLVAGGYPSALRSAGSALFTLGLSVGADGHNPSGPATALSYLAAGTGLGVVALEIAYLPTIYGAFNRRETLVTMLESRAGAPAWGPEILARHQLVGITESLPDFYAAWEQWAADVAESHSTYPVVVLFRSPSALRSWIVGLVAVLDSAALYLALSPEAAPSEARLCLRMGFTSLRAIAPLWGIEADLDPMPDAPIALAYDDYVAGVSRLEQAGFPTERSAEEAWPHFKGWRVNYEATAYRLAEYISAVPGPWSGPRRRTRNIEPRRPVDRTPEDPEGARKTDGQGRLISPLGSRTGRPGRRRPSRNLPPP